MTNWRTNLGGAISVLGTSLIGVGLVPQVSGAPNKFLTWVAVAGFICSALGKSLTALFAADAKSVATAQLQISELQQRSNIVPNAIESGDTSLLRKAPVTITIPPANPVLPNPPNMP